MSFHRLGRGWLFEMESAAGVFHLVFSRSDNTLCGSNLRGIFSSLRPERNYCPQCWAKAVLHFPELEAAKKS